MVRAILLIYENLYGLKSVKFFVWTLIHKGINTNDKIQSRYPSFYLNPSWCILCKSHNESMDHLFATCVFSKSLWHHFYSYIDPLATSPANVEDLLAKFLNINTISQRNILLSNLCGATLLCIWLDRNNRIFHGGDKSQAKLWEDIISLASFWCKKIYAIL